MKLSCLPVSLYPALSGAQMTLQDWFDLAASLGLDGADISVVHLTSLETPYLAQLRSHAATVGLRIPMLVTYSDFTQPSAAERARQADMLKRQIDVAHELGASFLRVTAGQAHRDVRREDGIAWAVEGLTSALDYAHQAGITLAYENHTRGYGWTANDFSQPADIFLEIVARTRGTGLGILFDTANNLAHGDDPLAVVREVRDRVKVVHVNDIRRAGHFEPVLAGTGVAPIVDLLRVLVDEGFDGWVSLEEASGQGPAVFGQAIEHVDRAWREAGGTPRRSRSASSLSEEEEDE